VCAPANIAFTIKSFRLEVFKSPFFKGGLEQLFPVFPHLLKGGRGIIRRSITEQTFEALAKLSFSVSINEVKDLNILKIRDPSLGSG
jgi:hypothetical protein